MTEHDVMLDEIVTALNQLTLAILALVAVLIALSWSLDDMAWRVSLFGVLMRRLTPRHAADDAIPTAPTPVSADKPSVKPSPAAGQAAKDAR